MFIAIKNLLMLFLRGLVDTDGCSYTQRTAGYEYYLVKITMRSKDFAQQVKFLLSSLGIKSYICRSGGNHVSYDVVLRRKNDVSFFMGEVCPRRVGGGARIRTQVNR